MLLYQFNLAALQPDLITKYGTTPGRAMVMMPERDTNSMFLNELVQFYMNYEVYKRTGISMSEAMNMERGFYLEWRDQVKEFVDAEREATQAELPKFKA